MKNCSNKFSQQAIKHFDCSGKLEESFECEELKLFKKWIELWESKGVCVPFAIDGIVDYEEYNNSILRILYILKETNKCEYLKCFLRDGAQGDGWRTWNNVVRWSFGLLEGDAENNFKKIDRLNVEKRKKYLRKIAAINLKKSPGGARSMPDKIECAVARDKDLLKEQIKLYQPDVIIIGGKGLGNIITRYNLIEGLSELKHIPSEPNNPIRYNIVNKTIIIEYYHPQYFRPGNKFLFENLVKTYRKIKEQLA